MLIACPECATSYDLAADALGAGRSVRCARCKTQWFATPQVREKHERAKQLVALASYQLPPIEETPAASGGEDAAKPVLRMPEPSGDELIDVPALTGESPPLAPMADDITVIAPAAAAAPPPGEDIEAVAARGIQIATGPRVRRGKRGRAGLAFMIVTLAMAVAAIVGWRAQIVRLAPQTASVYAAIGLPVNLRGLAFRNIKSSEEMHEGVPVLVVEGEIVNVVTSTVEVPRLRFSVRNAAGVEVYAWTAMPSQSLLAARETLPFRSRLASPPADTRDVQVRFFHRRDLDRGI